MLHRRNATHISRLVVSSALCAAVLIAAPTPAHAWFGWLDKMSGPGPYKGLLVETRLVCFGDDTLYANAGFRMALTRLESLLDEAATDEQFNALFTAALAALQVKVDLKTGVPTAFGEASTSSSAAQHGLIELLRGLVAAKTRQERVQATRAFLDRVEQNRTAVRSLAAIGTFWSACGDERNRQWSFEIAADFWWANGGKEFADGQPVRFITLMPAVTYRVFPSGKADVLDVGIAAGRYWITSKGFDSLDGWVLQPLRLGFHPPTPWLDLPASDFRRWLAPITARFAITVVPGGFDEDDFNAVPERRERIGAEALKNVALFYNVTSLLRRRRP
jgi:hypothetical protein